jgi:hypothetical protein
MKASRVWSPQVRRELLVLAAYIALSLAFCHPLVLHLSTDVAGRYVDTRVFQWNNWWVKHALLDRLDLDYTRYLYYPSGASLVTHNMNWVSSLLTVPLDLAFGPLVAYNLSFLLTFFLTGYTTYLLVRRLAGHRGAAFLAGLVFAFAPYHVSGNFDGQMNLANVQWIPLCVLFLLRIVDHRRWQDAIAAGVFGALASLDCWFFAIFLGMWGLIWMVHLIAFQRQALRWQTVGLLAMSVCVVLLLTAPFLVPLIGESSAGVVKSALRYFTDKPTDLLSFFIPSIDHPLLQGIGADVREQFSHWRPAFLGYLPLGLALYAGLSRPRQSALWLVSGAFFAALALGTTLEIGGVAYPKVPMPFALLVRWVPALQIVRQSSRFNVMVSLSLAVLVGLACADLSGRLRALRPTGRRGWLSPALLSSIGVVVVFEYLALPCPLSSGRISPFYHRLARDPADLALLELPIDDFHSREYLYPQTVHHKKLVNGYVARTAPEVQGFIEHQPLLRKLQIQMEIDSALHDVPAEMALLSANGVRYVVVHKLRLPPQPPVDAGVLETWHTLFGPQAEYADEEISVYRLPPPPAYEVVGVSALPLGAAAIDARRAWLPGEELIDVRLTWTALEDVARSYGCQLVLSGPGGPVAQTVVATIAPRYPTERWPSGVIVADRYAIPIESTLPAGTYELEVRVIDLASGETVGTLTREIDLHLEADPFVPALQDMGSVADVTYGGTIRLLGYTPYTEGGRLTLDMVWLALDTMDTDYKVFVHVIDPVDGRTVVQADTMPRNWSYPTSMWGRGEVFVDRVELDVSAVPAGAYQLAVGMYVPDGDRLSARDAGGVLLQNGRAPLDERVEVHAP